MHIGPQTECADRLHAMKYRGHGEDFREAMNRIAFGLKDNDQHYHDLRDILLNMRFLPGGRIQSAIGAVRKVTSHNCFVSGTIADSFVEGKNCITQMMHEAATTMRLGGGIGYDFSTLRPRGDLIRKLMSHSCGPIQFMRIFNEICLCVASAGHRRGAQMGVLRVDHPDIEEFIHAKQNTNQLNGFNISIAVTDEFLEAAFNDKPFDLRFNGQTYRTVEAASLWEMIMRSTWDWAEPGIMFIDRINEWNNLNYCETISATNPCFDKNTLIVTSEGAFPIEDLVSKEVTIWNGRDWQTIDTFRETGQNQEMLKIGLQDGSELRVTPYHKMVLSNGRQVEAKDLKIDDELMLHNEIYNGNVHLDGAYFKGFLLRDGCVDIRGKTDLYLYEPKYDCKSRLIESAAEIKNDRINTNSVVKLGFVDQFSVQYIRCEMQGLAPKKEELRPWASTYKNGLSSEIYQLDYQSKCELIAGLFDADGTALDSCNGFSYQLVSISRQFLLDVQILLKSIGIRSKLGKGLKEGLREIGGKKYFCQQAWRLSIGQASSVLLAQQVKFERLLSFDKKQLKYNTNSRAGKVISIEKDGIDDKVYCCTVENSHKIGLAIGIIIAQCGEQPLPPYGACLLGSFNLPRYLKPTNGVRSQGDAAWEFNYHRLIADIPHVVRAMDNVIDRSLYPLAMQKAEAITKRRMGLGVSGLANTIEAMGYAYGTSEFLGLESMFLELIRDYAYLASVELAKEKGSFPLYDEEKYLSGKFVQTLPDNVRFEIKRFGIRNSHLTSIAPTGTISMCADNVSSAIEPVFGYSIERPINTSEGVRVERISDYGVAFLNVNGKLASEVSAKEHIDVLATAQKYVDSAVSKTVNMDSNLMSWSEFKDLYKYAWEQGCKSCATFNISGKRMALLTTNPEEGTACMIDSDTGRMECA